MGNCVEEIKFLYYGQPHNKTLFKKLMVNSMEFDNMFTVGPLQRSKETPDSSFNRADVVFLEGMNRGYSPLVYQLRDEAFDSDLRTLKYDLSRLDSNAFSFVGEVQGIDKKKKIIYLVNGATIAYRHLIMSSGTNLTQAQHEREFCLALKALADALLVKKISYYDTLRSLEALLNRKILSSLQITKTKAKDLSHVAQDYLPQDHEANHPSSLNYSHSFSFQL